MTEDEQEVSFYADALVVPGNLLVRAYVIASWELKFAPHDQHLRGVLAAFMWLGQRREFGPVTGESRLPVQAAIEDEHEAAVRTSLGMDDGAHDIDPVYAGGVADMLAYASIPGSAEPVQFIHAGQEPPS